MTSGGQIYLSLEEIDLILEAVDELESIHIYEHPDKQVLKNIKGKLLRVKAKRLEIGRPLKFSKNYKDDTPLIVSKGYGKEKYYEVMVMGQIKSPHGFMTYKEAQEWAKENL